jgi:hypothetical protein
MLAIVYRDELGIVECEPDFGGVTFEDGYCLFECDGKEYRVKTENIVEIYAL